MNSTDGIEASELFQAQTHLYKLTYNWIISVSVKSAVELGIPDIIHNHGKPITLHELTSALQLHPTKTRCLHSFLRLLVHNGFFATTTMLPGNKEEEEAYVLTPTSKLLLKDNEPCLSPLVLESFRPYKLDMWHSSKKWLDENKEMSLLESASGMGYWDHLTQNPKLMSSFDESMVVDSQMIKFALKDCKQVFGSLGSIVDVGGGTGTVARLICEAFPNLKCTVFDLPPVVANLSDSQNLSFVGGDMFQSIPSADAVLLKWVLHNWSDEDCIKILKNCREAISSRGEERKVIIIDIVLDEKNDSHELTELKLYYDIMMMSLITGRERNEKELKKLFLEAGFKRYKITPIFGFKSFIEVYP